MPMFPPHGAKSPFELKITPRIYQTFIDGLDRVRAVYLDKLVTRGVDGILSDPSFVFWASSKGITNISRTVPLAFDAICDSVRAEAVHQAMP